MALFWNTLSEVKNLIDSPKLSLYEDLIQGLQENPRCIPSKYFYDSRGSEIFERITRLPEYYPTRCEAEILSHQAVGILSQLNIPVNKALNIVELGAGSGVKTFPLLEAARGRFKKLTYRPVDISAYPLVELQQRLSLHLPEVNCEPCELDMELDLHKLPLKKNECNLILYLGSSIGNSDPTEQREFLKKIYKQMNVGDFLLIGFDLKKDPDILQLAYNDGSGVTKEFNMNLLSRLNRELEANFQISRFRHVAIYNPIEGAMESWLVSLEEQVVRLGELDFEMNLKAFESIHVETSWKFSPTDVQDLARKTGFQQRGAYYDARRWFMDAVWQK